MKKQMYLVSISLLLFSTQLLFPMQDSLVVPDNESMVVHGSKSPSHYTDYSEASPSHFSEYAETECADAKEDSASLPGYVAHDPVALKLDEELRKKSLFNYQNNATHCVYVTGDAIDCWARQLVDFFNKPGGYLFLLVCRDHHRIKCVMDTVNSMDFDLDGKDLFFYVSTENLLIRALLEKNKFFQNKEIQYELMVACKKYFSFLLNQELEVDERGPLAMIYEVLNNPISLDELFTEQRQDYCIAIGLLLIILNRLTTYENVYNILSGYVENK